MAAPFDTAAFWAKADRYLMKTGMPFLDTIVRSAKGAVLYDVDGKELLDFTSGQMSSLLGHSHPEIVEVVTRYAGELDHLMSLMICEPVVQFAEDLGKVLPAPLQKSFLLSTGSESVEAAIKMAKCATGKFEVVAFANSYHGVTSGAASATYAIGRSKGGPVMPGQISFPSPNAYRSVFRKNAAAGSTESESVSTYDWETEMAWGWAMVDAQSVGSLAAFVFEPILSAGGIFEPPPGYMQRLALECKKRGMLLIADEAQTGLGRTGDLFAFQRDGIVPDILALSKTIGCGLPVASVSTTPEIEAAATAGGYLWVTTHYNDPLPAAVASKVVEIVVRDDLSAWARARGEQLLEGMRKLQEKYWVIGDIRGRGLLLGMEIVTDRTLKTPGVDLSIALSMAAMNMGLSCQVVAHPGACGVFRLAPPINITVAEVEQGLDILERAFAQVFSQEPYSKLLEV